MLLSENGCMYEFCCAIVFMMLIIFSVDNMNTKVVDNFFILLMLKCHDHIPVGLGVMLFTSLPLGLLYMQYSSKLLFISTMLASKLDVVDN